MKSKNKKKKKANRKLVMPNADGDAKYSVRKKVAVADFNECVDKMGYVKARTYLKKIEVRAHLEKIKKADAEDMIFRRGDRLKEMIRLSNTTGAPSSETAQDKILALTAKRPEKRYEGQSTEDMDREFDNDIAIKASMSTGELLIPQVGIENLPIGLGDTLFLQMGFVRNLNMPRNKLHSLLSFRTPQIQMVHFRYLTDINLSGNKLSTLPPEVGTLKNLKHMNLSANNIFKLPASIGDLEKLETVDLGNNNLSSLIGNFSQLHNLEEILLNNNMFKTIPPVILKLRALKRLNFAFNALQHVAIIPDFLTMDDVWHEGNDPQNGSPIFVNVLTKERIKDPAKYDGGGIRRQKQLHTFQPQGSLGYIRRRVWLSVCHVTEWEPVEDVESGWIYYRNNVSGDTTWDMPLALDTFDGACSLEELILNNNMLKGLCESMCRCPNMKKIVCSHNRLHTFPQDIGLLQQLVTLQGEQNEMKIIPTSVAKCAALKEITVQGNQLIRLPDLLGTLPSLTRLDCSNNRIKTLPYTLGFSKTCTYIACHENPLEDPDMDEVNKGLDSLKWYLRQKLLIDERGRPPAMIYEHISVRGEVTILNPEWRIRIKHMMQVAESDGFLNLQLMGLREFPKDVLKMGRSLKKLRLDFNDRMDLTKGSDGGGFPEDELSHIRLLSLRGCKQTVLPDSISNLKRLTVLNIEENYYEYIPRDMCRIRSIVDLNASKNHLYDIPPEIKTLSGLRSLNLENNYIEDLPLEFFKLKKLSVLNFSKNRLVSMRSDIIMLTSLRKLNLERNNLTSIPECCRDLALTEFKVGHNRIFQLPDDLFLGKLGHSVMHFSCAENNLLELPASTFQINPKSIFEADYNPLISPPTYILSEGLGVLQNYLHVRLNRVNELEDLLDEEDFEFLRENGSPIAAEVLEEGTGFLTPNDLEDFDSAVDEYVNGDYFRCPSSGVEIVEKLTALREKRENDLYLAILRAMSAVKKSIAKDRRFGRAVVTRTFRPWGRNGEEAPCTVLSLQALLNDAPENIYQKEGRPSLYSLIETELPEMPFPFSVDMLKDALRLYSSPYGVVAETEEFTFDKCDCINPKTKRPTRHNPCRKPAVIFLNTIFTEDEAERREEEEDDYVSRFEYIDSAARRYLNSEVGRKALKVECKFRRKALREEISLREEMKFIEMSRKEKVKRDFKKVEKRVAQFEEGVEFDVHEVSSKDHAKKLLDDADKGVQRAEARFNILIGSLEKAYERRDLDDVQWRSATVEDMVMKYCHMEFAEVIKRYRKIAIVNSWNRPWDGVDGLDFEKWKNRLGSTDLGIDGLSNEEAMDKLQQDDEDAKFEAEKEAELDRMRAAEHEGKPLEEENTADFDWLGTDNMDQYHNFAYAKFKTKRDGFTGAMSAALKGIFG
jgi:Leucine-rich repeat (LRR) protein